MKIKEKIGLIGVGNMGGAILEGLFRNRLASGAQVWAYDKITEKAAEFAKRWKVHAAASSRELVSKTSVIILAVKPQDLFDASSEFRPALKRENLLISILAGTPIAKIRQAIGHEPKVVRAMPNLGAKVGQAVTALAGDDRAALSLAGRIFSGCGKTLVLEEKYFDLVTAVSGSGPAYFFFLMELLAAEARQSGLPGKEARLLAVQTAVGAGLLAQGASESPEELRKMVTSKGGTTEAALKVLMEKNFPGIFHEALAAAAARSRELSAAKF